MASTGVNSALITDETLLPHLQQNGDVDQSLMATLAAVWDKESLTVNPNDTKAYSFKGYYTAMIEEVATLRKCIQFYSNKPVPDGTVS